MICTIDFETRSACDIKTAGAHAYSEHPSTEIQCLCAKFDNGPVVDVFVRGQWPDFNVLGRILSADRIVAHNAEFEYAIWTNVGVKKHGWLPLDLAKLDCTAARAAMLALPRNLEGACTAMNLPVNKDKAGYSLMLRMCKPRPDGTYLEDKASLAALVAYCRQDVEAEAALDRVLPSLPSREKAVWLLTAIINLRGARIDRAGILAVMAVLANYNDLKLIDFKRLTKGQVTSPRQVAQLLTFLEQQGVKLDDLRKDTVAGAIKDCEGDLKQVLEIRRSLGKASVSKYGAAIKTASADDRMRGLFMYHGASTGRWTAQRFQPHNMIRDVLPDAGNFFHVCRFGDLDTVREAYANPKDPNANDLPVLASRACRAMVQAEPGKTLFVGDFSAIEGRVLAWLACEEDVLDVYRSGGDPYKVAASYVYRVNPKDVTKAQRQIGKVVELASGYQGWVNAFHSMAKNYGVTVTDEEAAEIVSAWRKNRPATVGYWAEIGQAAVNVIRNPDEIVTVGAVTFEMVQQGGSPFMTIKLPSGRRLWYSRPSVVSKTVIYDNGKEKVREEIHYWGVDSTTKRWGEQRTYSGCLVENITQAVARDLLAASMFRAEVHGFPIVLHVHDEIVSEADPGQDVKEFEHVMSQTPEWAAGLPMKVEAFKTERYGK